MPTDIQVAYKRLQTIAMARECFDSLRKGTVKGSMRNTKDDDELTSEPGKDTEHRDLKKDLPSWDKVRNGRERSVY